MEANTMAPSAPSINVTTADNKEPGDKGGFNPALTAVIVAMAISFFVVGFATGFLKRCIRPAEDDDGDDGRPRSRSRLGSSTFKRQRGLDPGIVESLPFIQYKDLPDRLRKCSDCSVCLATYDTNDCLRLLPECSHAFHSDCIDAWFRSHNTCPLCRACLAFPTENKKREEREGNSEQATIRAPEGSVAVEVVSSGTLEQGSSRSPAISRLALGNRTGGASVAISTNEEERVCLHPFVVSDVEGSFKPAVRVIIAHEKAAALVSIRRSNSTGTEGLPLLHPSFVVDSEGTQHNRNYQTHATNAEAFLPNGSQAQATESFPRYPANHLLHNWIPVDLEAGSSSETQPISRLEPQRPWWTVWRFPNLRRSTRPSYSRN